MQTVWLFLIALQFEQAERRAPDNAWCERRLLRCERVARIRTTMMALLHIYRISAISLSKDEKYVTLLFVTTIFRKQTPAHSSAGRALAS